MKLIINSHKSLLEAQAKLLELFNANKYLEVDLVTNKKRTLTQNAALHKYCKMLADALNAAGYDVRKTVKHNLDIPWNERLVKELIWRTVQEAVINDQSTTRLNTKQVSEVYEIINRYTAEKFGISVPFPCLETRED